jgi:hypothetical protein
VSSPNADGDYVTARASLWSVFCGLATQRLEAWRFPAASAQELPNNLRNLSLGKHAWDLGFF